MHKVNLFEQQARLDASNVRPISNVAIARIGIQKASLPELRDILAFSGQRLLHFKNRATGDAEANIAEAIDMLSDVLIDLQGAIDAPEDKACECGQCDACVAARSDEHHDRMSDARDSLQWHSEAAGRSA